MNWQRSKLLETANTYLPFLVYCILSIVVLFPLLKPGYIFTLDSTQTFTNPISRFFGLGQGVMATSAGIPVDLLNFLFGRVFPPWIFEKILLLGIFLLAGLGAHRLVGSKGIGPYFAGVLYVINPFTYIRFMAGQWGLLWAYAIMPFAVKAFLEAWDKARFKAALKLALLAPLVGLLDIHGFFLLILIVIILSVIRLVRDRREQLKLRQIGKTMAMSIAVFLLLNLYWIIPALTSQSTLISQIGQADMLFFAPHATSALGTMFDVASLWGFWRIGYFVTGNFIPFWWAFFVIILFLTIFGGLFQKYKEQWFTLSFAIIGIIAFLLAVGAASSLTSPMFNWLWQNVPFFNGFRDSQKFTALLCLVYAVLGGLGVNELIRNWGGWQKRKTITIIFSIFTSVIVLTYGFPIFGFHGQLKTTDYPKGWYSVNEYLNEDKADFNVLFLPWHEYMDFSWLPTQDKDLSNPAQQFFDKHIIAGDNMESGGIYSQSTNPISKYVEFLLSKGTEVSNLGELLAPLNVKYIILVNEADYQLYAYVYKQKDLKIVKEEPGITLFENEHSTARTYAANNVVHIQSLDDYLQLSQTQDVMEHVYVLGSGPDSGNTEPFTPINTIEKSPVNYKTGTTVQQYTIFTVTQDVSTENWIYNGQKPIMTNLGFMPVFESSTDNGNVVYNRFYSVYLPSFIISGLTFIGIILFWVKSLRKKHSKSASNFKAK
jgi:hypothetical protein